MKKSEGKEVEEKKEEGLSVNVVIVEVGNEELFEIGYKVRNN